MLTHCSTSAAPRHGRRDRTTDDGRGAQGHVAARQARDDRTRRHHGVVPRRQDQSPHHDQRHCARHRHLAGQHGRELRPAARRPGKARPRDVPAPHRCVLVPSPPLPRSAQPSPTDRARSLRAGRTGRFGRQGVSINFVHDRRSFEHMEAIRKALGKPIVRVDTADFEQMEAVRRSCLVPCAATLG